MLHLRCGVARDVTIGLEGKPNAVIDVLTVLTFFRLIIAVVVSRTRKTCITVDRACATAALLIVGTAAAVAQILDLVSHRIRRAIVISTAAAVIVILACIGTHITFIDALLGVHAAAAILKPRHVLIEFITKAVMHTADVIIRYLIIRRWRWRRRRRGVTSSAIRRRRVALIVLRVAEVHTLNVLSAAAAVCKSRDSVCKLVANAVAGTAAAVRWRQWRWRRRWRGGAAIAARLSPGGHALAEGSAAIVTTVAVLVLLHARANDAPVVIRVASIVIQVANTYTLVILSTAAAVLKPGDCVLKLIAHAVAHAAGAIRGGRRWWRRRRSVTSSVITVWRRVALIVLRMAEVQTLGILSTAAAVLKPRDCV